MLMENAEKQVVKQVARLDGGSLFESNQIEISVVSICDDIKSWLVVGPASGSAYSCASVKMFGL